MIIMRNGSMATVVKEGYVFMTQSFHFLSQPSTVVFILAILAKILQTVAADNDF